MLELEENSRRLELLKQKTQSLGESLWHCYIREAIKRIRKRNGQRRVLAKSTKWNRESFSTNKTNKKQSRAI